jgi:hypothetical protein
MVAPGGLADISWNPVNVEEDVVETGIYRTVLHKDVEGSLPTRGGGESSDRRGLFRLIVGNHPDLRKLSINIRYFENQQNSELFLAKVTIISLLTSNCQRLRRIECNRPRARSLA